MQWPKGGQMLLPLRLGDTFLAGKYPGLSGRETEILLQVREGQTDKQIARDLGLSERTVQHHVQAICQKLDATNRTHAVVIAMRRAIIALE